MGPTVGTVLGRLATVVGRRSRRVALAGVVLVSSAAVVAPAAPVAAASDLSFQFQSEAGRSIEPGSGDWSWGRVSNQSTGTVSAVTLRIELPAVVDLDGWDPEDACSVDAGTIVCPLGDIPRNGIRTVGIGFVARSDAPEGNYSVQWSVTTGSAPDPIVYFDDFAIAEGSPPPPPVPDVSVNQRVGQPGGMAVGVENYFALSLGNGGEAVFDVAMFNRIPEEFEVVGVSDTSSCNVVGQLVTCTYSSLAPDETRDVEVRVIPLRVAGLVTNTVYVGSSSALENGQFWDIDELLVTISPSEADVGVSIADLSGTHTAGQTSQFQVSVNNDGPQLAHDVSFVMHFDDSLSLDIIGCDYFQYIDAVIAYCEIDDLAAGATVDFDVFATPSAAATAIELSATVSTGSIDENPDNNQDSLTFDVQNPGPPDLDDDGILDDVDLDGGTGAFPGAFRDGHVDGTIVSVPDGWSVLISDEPDPDGVRIEVEGGAGTERVELSVCGYTLKLSAGSDVVLTCGSVVVEVISGMVEIELGGGLAVVTIPERSAAIVDTSPSGAFTVDVQAGSVTVKVDGVVTTLDPGDGVATIRTWDFVGFEQPVDVGDTTNSVKAGRAVPLKWRLLDETGAPVLDLASVELTFLRTSCDGGAVDTVEETVTVGSGLQNNGDGRYQLNWKTPSTKGCGTLQLDVGDGVLHTAKFRLT